jgi:hypothetical protein
MIRNLLNGTSAVELGESKTLTVKTKCPEKWLLIDQETGEVYRGFTTNGKNSWEKIDNSPYTEMLKKNNAGH